jgi:hypothetical protein
MRSWRYQRGELQPGCIVSAILLAIVALIAIKTIPTMIRVYDFDDQIARFADRANRRDYPVKRIRVMLANEAQRLRIPITADDIDIKKTSKFITIKVEYELELDYGVYTYVWRKKHFQERPLF